MSTTSGTSRVLRSGSRARSDGGAGPPTAAPYLTASTRSNRGRGSRRAASPAVAANLPDDEVPELNPAFNRAYGTAGKPATVQHQSANLGMDQAVEGINKAVFGAEVSNNAIYGSASQLAAVDEEDESSAADPGRVSGSFAARFAQPATGQESISNWAVRLPQPSPGNRFMFSRGVRDGRGGLDLGQEEGKWSAIFDTLKLPFLTLAILGLCAVLLISMTPFSLLKNFGISSASSGTNHNITNMDYSIFRHRLDRVEQRLYDIQRHVVTSANHAPPQHRINWFTPGFGAWIDIELSSPTAAICDPTWKPWPFSSFFKQSCPILPLSPPQKMALQTWDDPMQDRWCAPRSGGKLQLAIEIERNILPTEFVVEYMAKAASPTGYMNSAPREVELWVRIEDDEVRAKVSAAIDGLYPDLWHDANLQGKVLHVPRDLGVEYVPVGRWEYNIWQDESAQAFKIPGPLLNYNFSSDKFAIRVNSNWGNVEFTCINQLRMYGSDKSGIMDELEDDPFSLV